MASTVLIMQENTEHQTSDPIPIDFLYRDTDIAVVNKPSGMLVHRGWDNDKVVAMTVVRDLVGQHVYPVHRLDRPTSGALIFALHKDAARVLSQEFEAGNVQKAYLALVRGITPESGIIDNPVPKKPNGKRVLICIRAVFTSGSLAQNRASPPNSSASQAYLAPSDWGLEIRQGRTQPFLPRQVWTYASRTACRCHFIYSSSKWRRPYP